MLKMGKRGSEIFLFKANDLEKASFSTHIILRLSKRGASLDMKGGSYGPNY